MGFTGTASRVQQNAVTGLSQVLKRATTAIRKQAMVAMHRASRKTVGHAVVRRRFANPANVVTESLRQSKVVTTQISSPAMVVQACAWSKRIGFAKVNQAYARICAAMGNAIPILPMTEAVLVAFQESVMTTRVSH